MRLKRGERLRLQRVEAAVKLVPAAWIWPAQRRRSGAIGARDFGVEYRGNGTPDVGDRSVGRASRCRAGHFRAAVEELDVRRQRDRDANQAVLCEVGEVVRSSAVDAEIIRVDRAKQRIVD